MLQLNKKNSSTFGFKIVIPIILLSLTAYYFTHDHPLVPPAINSRFLLTINTARIAMIQDYCTQTGKNITSSDRTTNSQYNSAIRSYLKANSTKLVVALSKLDLGTIMTEIQINGIGTIVFIAPFLLGLILLLLIWPFLLCCCICQDDCPAKCCRDRNPQYSACQLNWPTVFLVIICLLAIAAAVPSMTNSGKFFPDFSCQISKFIDDFYNGNANSQGDYFFSGVKTFRSQLTTKLAPAAKLSAVKTEVDKLKNDGSNDISVAITKANAALTSLQNMPNGANNLGLILNYNFPLQASSSTDVLPSQLASKIGSFGVTTSLLGKINTYITTLLNNLTAITTAAVSISPHLVVGDMDTVITATDAKLALVQGDLDTLQKNIKNVLPIMGTLDQYNTQYSIIFYGIVVGIAALSILGIIFTKCFSMISCRYCIYLVCFIAFFMGIVMFLLALILSLLMPSVYYTCDYFSTAFDSPTKFGDMMKTIGGDDYNNIIAYFSQCFGGTNQFMTAINPTLKGYMTDLKNTVQSVNLYDFPTMVTSIDTQLNQMQTLIDNYGLGHLPDFDVTSTNGAAQINFMKTIANKDYFSVTCPSASYSVFYTDVWVPGLSSTYQSYVDCGGKISVDATTCTTMLTGVCPTSHCLDTFSILSSYYRASTAGNIVSDANTRYTTCTSFDTYLTNYLNNYVQIVNDQIGNNAVDNSDNTKLAGRFVIKTKTPVNDLKTHMNTNVKTVFQQTYGNISTTAGLQSIFDPVSGLITGMDCRMLKQDFINTKQALCISTFNRIYFTLVTVGIMSFCLFFMVCCLLCFAVRHYRSTLKIKNNLRVEPDRSSLDDTDVNIKMK